MKWNGSNDVRSRRLSRHASVSECCVSLLCLFSLGCHSEVEEPALAPQLLHDEAEMAAYLDAFPYDRFQISDGIMEMTPVVIDDG